MRLSKQTTAIAVVLAMAACGSKKSTAPDQSAPATPLAAAQSQRTGPLGITSPPSKATITAANKLGKIEILFFAPMGDERDQVVGYLEDLATKIGGVMTVRVLDRLVEFPLGNKHKVKADNTIIVTANTSTARLTLKSTGDLQLLDGMLQQKLTLLALQRRNIVVVYGSGPVDERSYWSFIGVLKAYGNHVTVATPSQARPSSEDILVVIDNNGSATHPWAELLATHLQAGGRAFVALEPIAGRTLGKAEGILGIGFDHTLLADETSFFKSGPSSKGHHALLTEIAERHPAARYLWMLQDQNNTQPTVLPNSGSLRLSKTPLGKSTALFRSMPTAFRDTNGNGAMDTGESANQEILVAAFESMVGRKQARAVVFASGSWLREADFMNLPVGPFLAGNALAWLNGVENLVPDESKAIAAGKRGLVTYPTRAREAQVEPQALWNEDPEGLTSYVARRSGATLTMKKRGEKWIGSWKIEMGAAPPRGLDENHDKHFQFLSAPVPMRSLGKLSEERLSEFDFDRRHTIEFSWGSKTHKMIFGEVVYGSKDRYLLDPETEEVHLFSEESMQLFRLPTTSRY